MNDTQISNLLKIGIRILSVGNKFYEENFILIPTNDGQWLRDFAKKIGSKWEGSYLPLIHRTFADAYTLPVEHALVESWKEVSDKIAEALGAVVYVKGD